MRMSRDLMRRVLLCLAGTVVASTSVACTSWGGAAGMEPGDRVDAVAERITAPATPSSESWLQLPEGRVELVVADPVSEVPADSTIGRRDLQAAAGATIVGVAWTVGPGGVSTPQTALAGMGEAPGAITLLAGDQRITLTEGEQWARRGALFVAVPEGAELSIEVDYDTVTQRVDVRTGRQEVSAQAQPLYEDAADPTDQSSCSQDPVADRGWSATMVCWARVTAVSYVHGVGWAPEHEPWQAVELGISLDSAMREGARYTVTESSGTALLDGSEPSLVVPQETGRGPHSIREYLVFPHAPEPRTLAVSRTWSLTRESGPATAPNQRDLELTGSVEID